jgi:pimeloyl-ACP methyl ester carboxylesterase
MPMTEVGLRRPDATLIGTGCGEGPPALLLHAGGERRQTWEPVAARLARAGYSSVAFDQRGHGDSRPARAGADRLHLFAADVEAMIGTLDAAPTLVGSSLGGLAALLALADPRLEACVAGLMLVDVVPDPPPDRTRARLARTLGARANQPLIDDILGRAVALRAVADRLSLPVTLVRGGANSAVTDADAGRLLELVPHATVATISSAGHLIARDAPIELATEVIAFVGDPRVRRRRIAEFLARSGTGSTAHPGGTLLSHLHRTADMLESWGASDWLVDAARLHAAYGTDGYPHPVHGADRATLVALAGARTEAFVARYCNCDRQGSYPTFLTDTPSTVDRHTGHRTPLTGSDLRAFAELTIVNELDVFAHAPDLAARHADEAAELFQSWLPLVSERARVAVQSWVREQP